jgi:hypothetical protein
MLLLFCHCSICTSTDKLLSVQRLEDAWAGGVHDVNSPDDASSRMSLDEWADWEGDSWLADSENSGSSKFLL